MIDIFVKRPAMTIMLVLVFVVMGIVSFNNIIIESTPKMDFPFVTVKAMYNGASPVEIETQMVKKIEDAVAEISQIKQIQSFSYEGFGFVLIEFEMGTDANLKAIEVKDKVESITNQLPRDANKPVVSKYDPLIEPVIDLVLVGDKQTDSLELYEYADKNLKNIISVIEGVASVEVHGGKERQINIKLDSQLMKKYFISIEDVVNTVSGRNINVPGGAIETDVTKENIRFLGEFESIDDIAQMELVSREGLRLKLSDIATVKDSYKKVETYTRYNGRDAVGLSVKKLSDGDAVSIIKKIRKTLEKIKKKLPENMELIIAYDSTINLLSETNNTLVNILIGIALTVLILFLFLENLRVTFIAAIVIPTSLISAFFPMSFSHFSINFITLLAIATSLGTLIANALVVLESVDQKLNAGLDPVNAAIKGTKEASVAVLASAGTNLVVFTPIAFMGGMVGQFMKQFGLTIIYATLFSILASFSLTPMLCALLLKPRDEKKSNGRNGNLLKKIFYFPQKLQKNLLGEYKIIFNKILKHPKSTLLISSIILISTFFCLKYIGNEFMPSSDQNVISADIDLPQGSTINKTLSIVKDIEDIIKTVPEVESYLSYAGIDSAEKASVTVNLIPYKTRKRTDMKIINSLIPVAAGIPGAEIGFTRVMAQGGSLFGGDVSINLSGKDYETMIDISKKMKEIMLKTGYFRSVNSSYKTPKEEIRFIPDDNKMITAGVYNSLVGDVIKFSVSGNTDNLYKEKGQEYKINIELDDIYKKTVDDIKNIPVMSKDGLLAISRLGKVIKKQGYSTIMRRNKKRVIQIDGYLSKSTSGQVQIILAEEFKAINLPEGYGYEYIGMAEMQEESAREISKAFLLAVIFTYMLLVSIMNSFRYPFVILTSVLTAFVGVFFILFFLEFSINIGSMMAMVMVVGLVVNNAILMLDYTLGRINEGKEVREALWLGASVKFRAILMTSLAVIFGALPQIFDQFEGKASIGAVIIGGMLASIFFTFFLIPVLFRYASKIRIGHANINA